MATKEVIRVQRALTSKQDPMWRCSTKDGVTVNIFANQIHMAEQAGYTELGGMETNDILTWEKHPIKIMTIQKGVYQNLSGVEKRPQGAKPDPRFTMQSNAPRLSVIDQISMLMGLPDEDVVIFDFETTGINETDEILSGAVITLRDGTNMLPDENIYVCPSDPQKAANATHIHGITPEFIAGKPEFPDVYQHFAQALHGKIWIAYNTEYDWKMIDLMCARHNLPPIVPVATVDAMQLYGRFALNWGKTVDKWRRVKLTEASEAMNVVVKDAHNAYGDIVMTRLLLHEMVNSD